MVQTKRLEGLRAENEANGREIDRLRGENAVLRIEVDGGFGFLG